MTGAIPLQGLPLNTPITKGMELRRVTLVFPILAILLILSLFGCGETSAPTELTTKTEKTIEDALQPALGS